MVSPRTDLPCNNCSRKFRTRPAELLAAAKEPLGCQVSTCENVISGDLTLLPFLETEFPVF